ncbi:MAG: DUF2062 domain-containing protein [Polyangiaceae bacterium]
MRNPPLRRLRERGAALWLAIKSERAEPAQIGVAVGVGAFVGCTPFLGFHGWIAVGAATLFRLNRLYCWVGSRLSNLVTLPWIALAEAQVAHRLRTGEWLTIARSDILNHVDELFLDWSLGLVPVGVPLAVASGAGGYVIARWRRSKLAPPLPPSSGSPPSDSPAPPT